MSARLGILDNLNPLLIIKDKAIKGRAAFLAPLIVRYGEAKVSLPGGCAIGIRPIDFYLSILKKMGVKINLQNLKIYKGEKIADIKIDQNRLK